MNVLLVVGVVCFWRHLVAFVISIRLIIVLMNSCFLLLVVLVLLDLYDQIIIEELPSIKYQDSCL